MRAILSDYLQISEHCGGLKMNVTVCSREDMEKLFASGLPERTAVISFSDPVTEKTTEEELPLDFAGKCGRVFQIQIHDIDIEILGDFDLTYETYFPEAQDLAEFIYRAKMDKQDIICQCEYGQSRSAGCAAAILEHFTHNGISIFADYRYYPNQMVYHKVFDALENYQETHHCF